MSSNILLEAIAEETTKKFGKLDPSDRKIYGKVHGENDLIAFAKYVDPDFEAPSHIQKIAEKLTQVESGEIDRLIINLPPRHGKSLFTSKIFPAWFLGKHPKREIITTAYGADLVIDFTGYQRNLCESEKYKDIFPKLKVRQDTRARERWMTEDGGMVIGAGVGGPITGRGADLLLIDDPIKNPEEAVSERIQDNIWDWYRTVALTRLYPKGRIVLIMTRWATNDLAGRLIESQGLKENGGAWNILKLPALSETGEALWPERYSSDILFNVRKDMGEKYFSSLYQQEPMDTQERLFDDPVFEEPPGNITNFAYLDPAFGGKDFSALTIGGIDKQADKPQSAPIYIAFGDIWRKQIDETYDKVTFYLKEYKVSALYVESNQAQTLIAREFRNRGFHVKEIYSSTAKHLRIMNNVKLNWRRLKFSRMVNQDYLKQILQYNELASHDDAPDSLAGLLAQIVNSGNNLFNRYDSILERIFR
ncbi:MAG: terminase family protein [Leptospiraceae bacterium]|nr:terminase family protein [Leptospiraceae bacterium]